MGQAPVAVERQGQGVYNCVPDSGCHCHTYKYDRKRRGFSIAANVCDPTDEQFSKRQKLDIGELGSSRQTRIVYDGDRNDKFSVRVKDPAHQMPIFISDEMIEAVHQLRNRSTPPQSNAGGNLPLQNLRDTFDLHDRRRKNAAQNGPPAAQLPNEVPLKGAEPQSQKAIEDALFKEIVDLYVIIGRVNQKFTNDEFNITRLKRLKNEIDERFRKRNDIPTTRIYTDELKKRFKVVLATVITNEESKREILAPLFEYLGIVDAPKPKFPIRNPGRLLPKLMIDPDSGFATESELPGLIEDNRDFAERMPGLKEENRGFAERIRMHEEELKQNRIRRENIATTVLAPDHKSQQELNNEQQKFVRRRQEPDREISSGLQAVTGNHRGIHQPSGGGQPRQHREANNERGGGEGEESLRLRTIVELEKLKAIALKNRKSFVEGIIGSMITAIREKRIIHENIRIVLEDVSGLNNADVTEKEKLVIFKAYHDKYKSHNMINEY